MAWEIAKGILIAVSIILLIKYVVEERKWVLPYFGCLLLGLGCITGMAILLYFLYLVFFHKEALRSLFDFSWLQAGDEAFGVIEPYVVGFFTILILLLPIYGSLKQEKGWAKIAGLFVYATMWIGVVTYGYFYLN